MPEVPRTQASALQELTYLSRLMGGGAPFEQQVDCYLEARAALAEYFKHLAVSELASGSPIIAAIKDRVSGLLESRLAGRVAPELLIVHGYTGVHGILLSYLCRYVGDFVRADRLRVLTGDQVHTERRVRELRDLGLQVEARKVSGLNQYCLLTEEPDLFEAGRYQLRKNLEREGTFSASAIALLQSEVVSDGSWQD